MSARRRKSRRERARWVRLRYVVRAALDKTGAMAKLYRAVMAHAGKEGAA